MHIKSLVYDSRLDLWIIPLRLGSVRWCLCFRIVSNWLKFYYPFLVWLEEFVAFIYGSVAARFAGPSVMAPSVTNGPASHTYAGACLSGRRLLMMANGAHYVRLTRDAKIQLPITICQLQLCLSLSFFLSATLIIYGPSISTSGRAANSIYQSSSTGAIMHCQSGQSIVFPTCQNCIHLFSPPPTSPQNSFCWAREPLWSTR